MQRPGRRMGKRVGGGPDMAKRTLAVFIVGILCGAVLLGGSLFTLQAWSSNAQAQDEPATWQVQYWSDVAINNGDLTPDPDRYIDDWVRALPSECDIVPMGDVRNVLFYRCP